ncbi:PilZ domain-containing protein [Novosphingobium profundi]|uniref:PilZ domain-containing protein n=1 Tax=Novosphingobium profundi TaxID=1774954 RepID=UPI001BDA1CD1|nr:PilZ domain-containing protein [Novosphingobium profundi]
MEAHFDTEFIAPENGILLDREPRQRTLMRAVMTLPGMRSEPVMVRNVSQNGMCLASKSFLPREGEIIELDLPGTANMKGHVRWVQGQEFGVRLSHPLDLAYIGVANQRRNGDMASTLGGQVESRLCRRPDTGTRPLHAC